MQGYSFELITGPMSCGKTEELLRRIRRCIIAKKKVAELKDVQSIIEDQTIATLLGYSINDGVVTDQEGNVVKGILAKVAPYSIKNIDICLELYEKERRIIFALSVFYYYLQ